MHSNNMPAKYAKGRGKGASPVECCLFLCGLPPYLRNGYAFPVHVPLIYVGGCAADGLSLTKPRAIQKIAKTRNLICI